MLAEIVEIIDHVPTNWKLVVAFDQEMLLGNEYVIRMWRTCERFPGKTAVCTTLSAPLVTPTCVLCNWKHRVRARTHTHTLPGTLRSREQHSTQVWNACSWHGHGRAGAARAHARLSARRRGHRDWHLADRWVRGSRGRPASQPPPPANRKPLSCASERGSFSVVPCAVPMYSTHNARSSRVCRRSRKLTFVCAGRPSPPGESRQLTAALPSALCWSLVSCDSALHSLYYTTFSSFLNTIHCFTRVLK